MGELTEKEIVAVKNTIEFLMMVFLRRKLTGAGYDENIIYESRQFLEITHPGVDPKVVIRNAMTWFWYSITESNVQKSEAGEIEAACFLSATGLPVPEIAADSLRELHGSMLDIVQFFQKGEQVDKLEIVLKRFGNCDQMALTRRYFEIRKELDIKYGGKAHRRKMGETLYGQVADELNLSVDGLKKRLRKT